MEREMIRVNTRMPVDLNEWLDAEAARTGLSKSAIVMMATENYRKEKEVLKSMSDMGEVFKQLQSLELTIRELRGERDE